MAVPQVIGTATTRTVTGTTVTFDISAIPNGSWMVASAMCSAASMTMTPPAGWTVLVPSTVTGTRSNFVFGKIRASGDANTATFTQGATGNVGYALMWGSGADIVANWTLGTQWTRAADSVQASGSRYDTIAKSVTTTIADSLVVTLAHEATNAVTMTNEIATIAPSGWTERLHLKQSEPSLQIETIWMGTKELASPGASGDLTLTYLSPQDNNAWARQLVIPPAPASLIPGTYVAGDPTTYTGSTYTGFTINRPVDAQTGDYIVVVLRGQSSSASVGPASTGFTRLGPAFVASTNTHRLNGFYGRPIADIGTEPTTYTFNFTADNVNTRLVATAFAIRGINLDAPLAGYFDSYGGTAITAGVQVDGYAVASTPVFTLFAGGSEFTATNDHTPVALPSGHDLVSTVVSSSNVALSRTYLWVGSKEEATSVATASITWGNPAGMAGAAAEGIALRTADTPTPDPRGEGYVAADGSGETVKIYHTIADDDVRTPAKVLPMLRGFQTVAESLAKPGFTWAHRGGSVSYAEMSLHAYTQSVARGYGALEVSLARTSDGVWFGLHDQTTDRTSGGTYGNASSQTWAQVQMQQNNAGPGSPQPYMRWEELIAAYGSTHIIVADPKYALGSYRTEFLNMVNRDLGPTRAIIKYSGSGSGAAALSNAAKVMGFETWGFFYAADASAGLGGNGNLQTWGPSWTLIGMDYTASQAVWDEALALGKPVIGHIAPNQTAYNTAMSKGASGVQVGGVGVVAPVSWWTP